MVIGGSPLRMLRLTDQGAELLDRVTAGESPSTNGATGRLLERLVDAGIVHPEPDPALATVQCGRCDGGRAGAGSRRDGDALHLSEPAWPASWSSTTARSRPWERSTARSWPAARGRAGRAQPATPAWPASPRRWWRSSTPTARRPPTGWSRCSPTSPIPASPRWHPGSSPHRGPNLASSADTSPCARRSTGVRSRAWSVRAPGWRTCRPRRWSSARRAARSIAGFDDSIDVGEDVDFVWRLHEAGWRLRYEPASVVRHHHRVALGTWFGRRADYGRSAAALRPAPPGERAAAGRVPLEPGRLGTRRRSAHPAVGAAVAATSVGLLAQRLDSLRAPWSASRSASRDWATCTPGRMVANAMVRPWWPATLAAALVSRRIREGGAGGGHRVPSSSTGAGNGRRSTRSATSACASSTTWPTAPACGWERSRSARVGPLAPVFPEVLRRPRPSGR